jgi:hypothetical protein
MIKDGWRLAHAIKTAQSAQLESFNFLHIFEKKLYDKNDHIRHCVLHCLRTFY